MPPSSSRPTIAVVSPNRFKYSETFIHAHLRLLPAEVRLLYGGYLPLYLPDGRPIAPVGRLRQSFRLFFPLKDAAEPIRKAWVNYLKTNKIELVLAEYGMTGVEMAPICREAGVPLVVHFHGYDAYRDDMLGQYAARYPEMLRQAAAVIVVSEHMKAQVLKLGAEERNLHLIPYGVDPQLFAQIDAGQNPPTVAAVGRFAETKSPHLTILAFHQVWKRLPEARLRMAGDGHLMDACQLLIRALKMEAAVELLGVAPPEKVSQMLSEARLFAQHSNTTPSNDTEGTPLAVLEAGARGLPVVSTRHAGIADAVIENETGFLVNEGDIDGMANAMYHLLTEPALSAEMGAAARRRIETHYRQETQLGKLWAVMAGCLKAK